MSKADLSVIIWKWIPVYVCNDVEIGAHIPGRSKSLSCSRADKLIGTNPDD